MTSEQELWRWANNHPNSHPDMRRAAFFDVDGTIVKSNIVMPYVHIRRAELSPLANLLWTPMFALKALVYILVDKVDRRTFNRMFYRNYRGRSVADKEKMAKLCFENYLRPNIFRQAGERIQALKDDGFQIILVTGSLDFIMQPLAEELKVDHMIASRLEEIDGRFTGQLEGNPVSDSEKVIRIEEYAATSETDLGASQAYGDSIADLPMLDCVGEAHAVKPDDRLRAIATARQWFVEEWE